MRTIRNFLAIVFASSSAADLTACAETNPALENIEAINTDVWSADFENRIGELDKTAHYYSYCRSGLFRKCFRGNFVTNS